LDDRLALPADTALVGSYRVMRVVGAGGFGITYEAEDTGLGAVVAIKEYYPFDFGDRDAAMGVVPKSDRHKETFDWGRANFLREARTLARFDHPSIVRVTRVFEANSTAYMVMRFEHGLSLEAWLTALGRPPTQEQLDLLAAPLLDALQMIHAADFLHGDIAPDNILIRADGTPVLLDFGSARRAVAEMSRSPTGIVKAGYSPHEQYSSDGRLLGSWSDIYALGGTFYRAVAGHPPEEATLRLSEDRMAPAAQVAKASYRPGFLNAIDWALSLSSRDRPGSIAVWRDALLGGDRTQSQQVWHPPRQSGIPGTPLEIADMRQWSHMVAAAQTDGLVASGPGAPATRLAEPRTAHTMARAPAAAATASRSRLLPAAAIAAIGAIFGLSLLSRSVRDAFGQLLAVINLKLNAIHFMSLLPGKEPETERDLVDCSVFSPPAVQPGSTVLVQAFLHVKSDATRVSVLASLMDTATALKGVQTLQAEISRGARVDLTISGAGLEIEEPVQSLIWQGEPTFAQFLVTLPRDAERQSYHPVIRLILDGKLVGRIVFRLMADTAASQVGSRPSGERAGPYTYAFVSYAAEDRKEVLKRVQMLDATRTAFFQDVLSLDPGARWTKELYKRIDKCDLFLLFWSSAAKRSEWVIREAEYALARQDRDPLGGPDIVPVILEGPPPVLPPDSLRHLHFNDRIQYFIAGS
jgi:serine/threonine protein kinase